MSANELRASETRINALLKQAKQGITAKAPKVFGEFLQRYYRTATAEDLAMFDDANLVAMAYRHWQLAHSRQPGEKLVEVFQPEQSKDGWQAPRCVVLTVSDDMPFVVDSVTLATRGYSPTVDWLIHPVMRVERDRKGRIRGLSGTPEVGEGAIETFVHMQIGPLAPGEADKLKANLESLFNDLRAVVQDWPQMQSVTAEVIEELSHAPATADAAQISEAQAFLKWMADHRFTYLGYCSRFLVKGKRGESYVTNAETGLGLLREDLVLRDPDGYVAPATELDKYAQSTRVLVISRGNLRSWIHHPEYMDVISVKRFAPDGSISGLHRFIGLFSNEAYASSPRLIPVVRHKLAMVTERAGLRPQSHAAKNFNQILETFPRDELFQASEDELYEAATGVLALREHQHLKLFVRTDRYRRYYACMVYMPRDRYSNDVRARIGEVLVTALNGGTPEISTEFLRRGMARLYYIVPTPEGAQPSELDVPALEQQLVTATRSWQDHIVEAAFRELSEAEATQAIVRFRDHLPAAYTAMVGPDQAVEDLQALMALEDNGLSLRLKYSEAGPELRVYSKGFSIALADLLPRLENFGLRALTQQPYTSNTEVGSYELQVLELAHCDVPEQERAEYCRRFEIAFQKCWRGEVENDGFNRLVLANGLDWRQVALLRTVCKYLLQTGLPYGQHHMEAVLVEHADITSELFALFDVRFNPEYTTRAKDHHAARMRDLKRRVAALNVQLDGVASLDADRVLRAFLGVVMATERSNFYQTDEQGKVKPWISLKIASARMPELPAPRPLYETFVYSPRFEGIHLRGGMVARGGLRWSDRRADFRTEILGLMKAQMVKNTVIVPAGAKGGFVVKDGPPPSDREAWLSNGIECYKTFLSGLLDITDNLKAGRIIPPPQVVRHDGDDPYLVVAADKGTAAFSDIANGVSEAYGHWLGDAFASGGSAGYDHKKMGITARGAWELVKRHFRELTWEDGQGVVHQGKDIQSEPFTVVGIGDMAGDVFGNGMLLSRHIRLVAAFNHQHIFLDPDPNPETTYAERQRLFKLPRSSWSDYDTGLISKGGGIFERSAKHIKLSKQVRDCLDIQAESLTPNGLISAILKAPVDLLWNGGIGTYVKANSESHSDVGDRANDSLRVNGRDLRCKVVGEGGNLGLTQAGRIEYALHGGRINTDAIDNSAGVDSSDREVNIKIPLNSLLLDNKLKRKTRDKLLVSMTKDVADLVLRTNYQQGQAISVMHRQASARLDEHANLMATLERSGLLNRAIEGLPDDDQINERRNRGQGLTRPELAVLLSYSKLSLYEDVVHSELPREDCLDHELINYFPPALVAKYSEQLRDHRLRDEIIATQLTNQVVNRMGAPFCHRLAEEHGVARPRVVEAFYAASRIYGSDELWQSIELLDNRVPADLQLQMSERVSGLLKHAASWLLYNAEETLGATIGRYADGVAELGGLLTKTMAPRYRNEWDATVADLLEQGVPKTTAEHLANSKVMGSALDIVRLSGESGQSIKDVATTYFSVGQQFSIPWLLSAVVSLGVEGRWQALARVTLRDDCYRLHRILTGHILSCPGKGPEQRLASWMAAYGDQVDFALHRLKDLQSGDSNDFMALTVAMRELRKLRLLKPI